MVVFVQNGCIRAKMVYSAKVVVFGQGGCTRQGVCIRAKRLYSGKSDCIQAKVVLFGQKWLCSCKIGCIREK